MSIKGKNTYHYQDIYKYYKFDLLDMVDCLNCIEDSFTTMDYCGGYRIYTSTTPIVMKDNYYRFAINQYNGNYLGYVHIDGRNADSEDWVKEADMIGKSSVNFISPGDYKQIKIVWNKTSSETNTIISYWLRPEDSQHKVAYVSNQEGNDTNCGSITFPYKTIAKAISMKPSKILLKKGEVFYNYIDVDGIDLGSYGQGNKPIISGLKILNNAEFKRGIITTSGNNTYWTQNENGMVWRICLSLPNDSYTGFATNESSKLNDIGSLIDPTTRHTYNCKRVKFLSDLTSTNVEDFDFCQPVPQQTGDALSSDFDYLYVYYSGDLRLLSIGVSVGRTGIIAKNCTIENIQIENWGRHGISGGSNLTIRNCKLKNIGGMIHLGYDNWVCLGNGIEFYVSPPGVHDSLVESCEISKCFDAGLTVQGSNDNYDISAINIIFRDNTIRNCCQSFEEFLRGPSANSVYTNCKFEFNRSYDAGIDTGYRYSDNRYKRCHILCNSFYRKTGMRYTSNYFYNGNFLCSGRLQGGDYDQAIWSSNSCRIFRGQDLLGNYGGSADIIKVPTHASGGKTLSELTEEAIAEYRTLTGDYTTQFTILN